MRILQVNTVYKEKSTGRTCYEVEKALNKQGHECITAYGKGVHDSKAAYRIDTEIEYYIHNIMSRITGLEGYYSQFATMRLIRFIKKYKPDVIHLRNLHGHYINLRILFKYLSKAKIPVVLNLHDMWAMTGKCCYYTTNNCNKWQKSCGNCPSKKEYPKSYLFDFSYKMRKDKEKWFSSVEDLTVVGVSKWVKEEAQKSFFHNIADITYIYNWIDTEVFRPYSKEECEEIKKKYSLPNKRIILGVSVSWKEGTPRFEDFVKLSRLRKNNEVIVIVGQSNIDFKKYGIVHIPFTSDTKELAILYNLADVYVHCSVEDTFGKVIAEAQACGTPSIVYGITGCKEIVREGLSGFVVEARNVNQIRDKIDEIMKLGKYNFIDQCIDNVNENFHYEKNVNLLIDLYYDVSVRRGNPDRHP